VLFNDDSQKVFASLSLSEQESVRRLCACMEAGEGDFDVHLEPPGDDDIVRGFHATFLVSMHKDDLGWVVLTIDHVASLPEQGYDE
jgi:hypothetical protein